MVTSKEVKARHDKVMFPCTANFYEEAIALESGEGTRLTDVDGNRYLDFFGGILTVSVGHSNPRVNAAVKGQIDRLGHVSTLYPTIPLVELAEKLVAITPGKLDRVYFTASGTEADETAVALAQLHTGSNELIALRHGYSGRSLLAQSLTAHSGYRGVQTQVAGIKHAQAPYCYRCPFGKKPDSCALECATDIEDLIQTTTTGRIAGFLAEPIMGVGGFITPPKDYFKVAVEIVRRYGGVFIADEVQSGFGRTGAKWWGIDQYDVEPDLMTMAKGIANGAALGACITNPEIADSLKGKPNLSTFGGTPVTSVAGLATIEVMEEEDIRGRSKERGAQLRAGLDDLKKRHSIIGDVRGLGLMQALELVADEPNKDRRPHPKAANALLEAARRRGLLIGKGGLYGNTMRIAPPMLVSASEVDDAIRLIGESLDEIRGVGL